MGNSISVSDGFIKVLERNLPPQTCLDIIYGDPRETFEKIGFSKIGDARLAFVPRPDNAYYLFWGLLCLADAAIDYYWSKDEQDRPWDVRHLDRIIWVLRVMKKEGVEPPAEEVKDAKESALNIIDREERNGVHYLSEAVRDWAQEE